MKLNEMLLPEFDHEMANTRKTLERVPWDKAEWRPHEKSQTMAGLATHIANIPFWASRTMKDDSFDLAPQGEPIPHMTPVNSADELLELFDKNVSEARAAIEGADDERLMKPWSLLHGGHNIFTMPRVSVLRSFVMNHAIHHRAQLGVYLRLNDVPVPSIYGPSADEGGM